MEEKYKIGDLVILTKSYSAKIFDIKLSLATFDYGTKQFSPESVQILNIPPGELCKIVSLSEDSTLVSLIPINDELYNKLLSGCHLSIVVDANSIAPASNAAKVLYDGS